MRAELKNSVFVGFYMIFVQEGYNIDEITDTYVKISVPEETELDDPFEMVGNIKLKLIEFNYINPRMKFFVRKRKDGIKWTNEMKEEATVNFKSEKYYPLMYKMGKLFGI